MNRIASILSLVAATTVVFIFMAGTAISQGVEERNVSAGKSNNYGNGDELADLLDRQRALETSAIEAFERRDFEEAEEQIIESLSLSRKLASHSKAIEVKRGHTEHVTSVILGLIELEKGGTAKAAEYLLTAGRISVPSPVLMTFGPDMLLAKRLLEKGERETVLKYLEDCAVFWQEENGRLAAWKQTIEEGGIPDFKYNLISVIKPEQN
ncbi:MAG: hypothetical protein KF855_04155 [Acidobacteria bacterium]|nr:hypothetical protein [Acidobacteriota bacterium]